MKKSETALFGSGEDKEAKANELKRIGQYAKILGMDGVKIQGSLKRVKHKDKRFYTWIARMKGKISGKDCFGELLRKKNGSLELWLQVSRMPDYDDTFMLNSLAGNNAPIHGVNISVLMKRIVRKIEKTTVNKSKKSNKEWKEVFDVYAQTIRKNMKNVKGDPAGEKEVYKNMKKSETALFGSGLSKDAKKAKQTEAYDMILKLRTALGMKGYKLKGVPKLVKYKGDRFYTWDVLLTGSIKGTNTTISVQREKSGSLAAHLTFKIEASTKADQETIEVAGSMPKVYGVNSTILMKRMARAIKRVLKETQAKLSEGDFTSDFEERSLKKSISLMQSYRDHLLKTMGKGDPQAEKKHYKGMPKGVSEYASSIRQKIAVASGK